VYCSSKSLTPRLTQIIPLLLIQKTLLELSSFNPLLGVEHVPMWVQAPQSRIKHCPVPAQNRTTSCTAKFLELIRSVTLRVIHPHSSILFGLYSSNCCLDSSRIANALDPRVETNAPLGEPRSTANPHPNNFLNLLDPRVDQHAARDKSGK
jgi:hypothetical protein